MLLYICPLIPTKTTAFVWFNDFCFWLLREKITSTDISAICAFQYFSIFFFLSPEFRNIPCVLSPFYFLLWPIIFPGCQWAQDHNKQCLSCHLETNQWEVNFSLPLINVQISLLRHEAFPGLIQSFLFN